MKDSQIHFDLLIVESPTKARTLRPVLGAAWRVAASFGHVRDLPASGDLAVAFRDGRVLPTYVTLEKSGGAANALTELTTLARQARRVVLATDPDREGEAIAWHLAAALALHEPQRAAFHALTKSEVLKALTAPRAIDQHLVDAQQARRVLDRVVGWTVSPLLKRVGPEAKSAGRVQSVALRLVAERERAIAAFDVKEFYVLVACLSHATRPPAFRAELVEWKGEPLAHRLADRAIAEKTVEWCRKQAWRVAACERVERQRHPPPPFTTASVQQAASVRLKLAPEQTMKLLQELFEAGRITYHRTDSVALAPEAIAAVRAVIAQEFSAKYLPAQPVAHVSKDATAQEAHEAIRPTDPALATAGDGDAAHLYELIRARTLASQMAAGRDEVTTIDVACAPDAWATADGRRTAMGVFRAKGRVIRFDGWRKAWAEGDDADAPKKRGRKAKDAPAEEFIEAQLPLLTVGDDLHLDDLLADARRTRPPPRFTQASLIKALERAGIGRPSTYAAILRTLFLRTYIEEKKRFLHATDLGLNVTDFLVRHFAGDFIEVDYTARMEGALDRIARGETAWEPIVTQAAFVLRDRARAAGLWFDPFAPRGG